ncbi:MAG: methyl-accepting chemotaxis protein [Gloeomargarita sp. SKYG116]|nr:methyl-accepting chemotaxis protein [Gloeomargarita sp. SKYG116]MDW8400403.1 methyl-accepting chemotaxis protein [Gloeomargarita sp. SKYGB_i_bin116]
MATSNYLSDYERATGAYISGDYAEAARIADALLQEHDDVPNLHLLRGHIYLCTQNYAQARQHYQRVLTLTDDPELVQYARNGINDVEQFLGQQDTVMTEGGAADAEPSDSEAMTNPFLVSDLEAETGTVPDVSDDATWVFEQPMADPLADVEEAVENPFAVAEEFPSDTADTGHADNVDNADDDPDSSTSRDRTLIFSRTTPPFARPETEEISALPEMSDEEMGVADTADTVLMDGGQRSQSNPADELGLFSFQEATLTAEEPLTGPLGNTDVLTPPSEPAVTRPGLKQSATSATAPVSSAPLPISSTYKSGRGIPQSWVTGAVVAALAGGVAFLSPNKTAGAVLAALVGGGAAVALSGGSGSVKTQRVRQFCEELRLSCEALGRGEFQSALSVVGQDEFTEAAVVFNQMLAQIRERFQQLQATAEEVERSREDLQRQVIRLLDDVEGAARGDLTVQAEVSADILGAVADSFNLIIQNIRQIVQQVKTSALQVGRGAMDSEYFARELSSNALRQAQELASTLNSVQMMTDSIQRVAESAREAAEVARKASAAAIRGGEAVDQTVAGIQSIRESVAETTRKVKRLAESSQEINKIVNSIGQIAQRTNLLALNASIEAAKAGEAGRGFAIVADEVRQLADRTSRASKEIEQIVLQIQSETGLVMTAMEEGTQAVIRGTRVAEQAKRALEEIIQVSKQIDDLVQSITADTVRQTEVSRNVTQVMQSVELTAQETSQEAQRVSVSLQNLVEVSRGLQASVERFRLGTTEPL